MKKIGYALLASLARMGPLRVRQPDNDVLVIARSRITDALRAGYGLGVMGLVYYLLLRAAHREPELFNSWTSPYVWGWLIGLIFPLLFVRKFAKIAVAAVKGVRFVFDRSTGLIILNGEVVGQFTDIEVVQLEELGEDGSSYSLKIIMFDGRSLEIEPESNNGLNLTLAAECIAEHTGKKTICVKAANGRGGRKA